jgi:hypothetical protein
MTIWTDWSQIYNWIDYVFAIAFRERLDVVDVNVPICLMPINLPEIESANATAGSMSPKTKTPSFPAAFVFGQKNLIFRPLSNRSGRL